MKEGVSWADEADRRGRTHGGEVSLGVEGGREGRAGVSVQSQGSSCEEEVADMVHEGGLARGEQSKTGKHAFELSDLSQRGTLPLDAVATEHNALDGF